MFYLTLPSNSSMDYFPNNTLTHYTTKLPQTIDLDGSWEMGLSEIHYPHSWFNVGKNEFWMRGQCKPAHQKLGKEIIWQLPDGFYKSPKWMVAQLDKRINKSNLRDRFHIGVDDINKRAYLQVKKNCQVILSPELKTVLGFRQQVFEEGHHESDWVADLNRGMNSLYVYCPLAAPRTVGDAQVPLLRIIPVEGKDAENIMRVFDPVQYFPLAQRNFHTIEIDIRDDTGKPVPFERGRVVVTLHFRKRRDTYL